jgi:hypothetical protein
MEESEIVQGFVWKARKKETTRKAKAFVRGI